jgi:hypothetical protein
LARGYARKIRDRKAKIMPMQNVEKGRLLEIATKLYFQARWRVALSWAISFKEGLSSK